MMQGQGEIQPKSGRSPVSFVYGTDLQDILNKPDQDDLDARFCWS